MSSIVDEHLAAKGLEAEVHGLPPMKSLDLERYRGNHIPRDWDIVGVTGDIIMAEYADMEEGPGELVNRGGILINSEVTNNMWRVCKIVLCGPGCSEQCKPGAYVMIPSDRGIPMTNFDGHNYIFINEERIFAFMEPKNKASDK